MAISSIPVSLAVWWRSIPITIMVLLLLSSNIYGVLGMIVAIPTYSILKEIAKFLANLYDNHKEAQQQKKNEEFGIINK